MSAFRISIQAKSVTLNKVLSNHGLKNLSILLNKNELRIKLLRKSLDKRYNAWYKLFGICSRTSRTPNYWHTYVITYRNFMVIAEPWNTYWPRIFVKPNLVIKICFVCIFLNTTPTILRNVLIRRCGWHIQDLIYHYEIKGTYQLISDQYCHFILPENTRKPHFYTTWKR